MAETLSDPPDRTFEDFALGDVIETRGRTLDAADFTAFAGLTGDHYPLHIDEEFCKGTRFGARIAHGPLTQSIAIGLVGMIVGLVLLPIAPPVGACCLAGFGVLWIGLYSQRSRRWREAREQANIEIERATAYNTRVESAWRANRSA